MELDRFREVQQLQQQIASLLLYQGVMSAAPGQTFLRLLAVLGRQQPPGERARLAVLRAYGEWFNSLAAIPQGWSDYVIEQLVESSNPFTQQVQTQALADLPIALVQAARQDLRILQSLYHCDGLQIAQWVKDAAGLPTLPVVWHQASGVTPMPAQRGAIALHLSQQTDWSLALDTLATYYRQVGIGLFGRYRAFSWQAGSLVGIRHPDPIRLDSLVGYERPRATLIQNTEALLAGYPALHVLLYGSRGSGKSSMVKALVNQYGDRGLRLIEVSRSDLRDLVQIVNTLRSVPQTFIIFVDDLSFEADDDAFKALKVVLEGNATARPQNIVVYATSNRRHLIREYLGDRPRPGEADEVHAWDTVQEKLSFSDRFGLTLTFEPANQETYLEIVRHLADQAGIALDPKMLEFRALQWATRHNGRSGRTARQYIDFLQAELALQGSLPVSSLLISPPITTAQGDVVPKDPEISG